MNAQQRNWVTGLKKRLPEHFRGKKVLEIGSVDINGNLRDLFKKCDYTGIDVKPGKGVDVVCIAHKFKTPKESFNVIYSTSQLEHDMYYKKTLKKMVELLKPGGLMFFLAPSLWFPHGITNYKPDDSLTTQMGNKWANYYHNITPMDIVKNIDLNKVFLEWEMRLDSGMDIAFWGLKR